MVCSLIFLSCYVWEIDIEGNNRLSDNIIMQTLEECGFYKGSFKNKLDISKIENEMMIKLGDLSRISINLDGSYAHIIIKERQMPPVSEDVSQPSNLIASMDGEIVKMEIVKGKPIASVGSGVVKGELLVAGFYNDKKDNIILEHSSGVVTAICELSKTFEISYKGNEKVGNEKKIFYSVEVFGLPIDFSFGKAPNTDEWNKIESKNRLSIFGLKFPIYMIEKQYTRDVVKQKIISDYEAKTRIRLEIEHYEKSELYEMKIKKKTITWKSDSDRCIAQVDYVVVADIAKQQYIETEQK